MPPKKSKKKPPLLNMMIPVNLKNKKMLEKSFGIEISDDADYIVPPPVINDLDSDFWDIEKCSKLKRERRGETITEEDIWNGLA